MLSLLRGEDGSRFSGGYFTREICFSSPSAVVTRYVVGMTGKLDCRRSLLRILSVQLPFETRDWRRNIFGGLVVVEDVFLSSRIVSEIVPDPAELDLDISELAPGGSKFVLA